MADCCDNDSPEMDAKYRVVLWVCLVGNAGMFVLQTAASYQALSVSLLANALDFFSDAANYGISLFVLSKSLKAKVNASLFKGVSLGLVGLWVAYETLLHALEPRLPAPLIMTLVSLLGLAVNIGCAALLYRYREGDSNRQSVWICSRNDAIGNIAVIAAAGAVYFTATAWPDIIVAAILGFLALSGARQIISRALKERKIHA
jgi:Co/Zn/Cd efflux system component